MSDTFLIIALVAWRSIWRNRRRTLITVSSIAFGLSLALFFVAMAEGGYSQLVNDAVRMYAGHVTVEHPLYEEAPAADRQGAENRLMEEVLAEAAEQAEEAWT